MFCDSQTSASAAVQPGVELLWLLWQLLGMTYARFGSVLPARSAARSVYGRSFSVIEVAEVRPGIVLARVQAGRGVAVVRARGPARDRQVLAVGAPGLSGGHQGVPQVLGRERRAGSRAGVGRDAERRAREQREVVRLRRMGDGEGAVERRALGHQRLGVGLGAGDAEALVLHDHDHDVVVGRDRKGGCRSRKCQGAQQGESRAEAGGSRAHAMSSMSWKRESDRFGMERGCHGAGAASSARRSTPAARN